MKFFAIQITKCVCQKNASVNSTSISRNTPLSLSLFDMHRLLINISLSNQTGTKTWPTKIIESIYKPQNGVSTGLLTAKLKCTPFIIVDLVTLTVYFLIQSSENIKCLIYFDLNCVIKFICIWSFSSIIAAITLEFWFPCWLIDGWTW